jgi:4-hydroxythreonine-4-phosphate dehydrogenase
MNASLTQDFGITKPRIAVLGLNPHAGDNGLIGKEEQNIIAPAVQKLNEEGILAFGPYAADGFFGVGSWSKFDGVMAMYHDQGLIPFKSIAFHQGVNFTAGLPFVRTSPDHGTAYDIAGKNLADPDSLREAIYAGIDIYRNRAIHKKIAGNPLQIMQKRERDRDR